METGNCSNNSDERHSAEWFKIAATDFDDASFDSAAIVNCLFLITVFNGWIDFNPKQLTIH